MGPSAAAFMEEDRHQRMIADIRERANSTKSSLAFEVHLGRHGLLRIYAIMAIMTVGLAILRPGSLVALLLFVAVMTTATVVHFLLLLRWFRQALSDELVTIDQLFDEEMLRHLDAIGEKTDANH